MHPLATAALQSRVATTSLKIARMMEGNIRMLNVLDEFTHESLRSGLRAS
jgi:hypothetical protein